MKKENKKDMENFSIAKSMPAIWEQNTIDMPLFTMDDKHAGSVMPIKYSKLATMEDGTRKEVTIQLFPNLGLGGEFDFRAFRIIEQRLTALKKLHDGEIPQPAPLGSSRSILTAMGYKQKNINGELVKKLDLFFKRILGYSFYSEGFFIKKMSDMKTKYYSEKENFVLYKKVTSIGQQLENGTIADQFYLTLGPEYLQNIQQGLTKWLPTKIYWSIVNNAARRIYELISIRDRWMDTKRGVEFSYDYICNVLQIKKRENKSAALQQIRKFSQPLSDLDILKSEPVFKIGVKDLTIIFRPNAKMFKFQKKDSLTDADESEIFSIDNPVDNTAELPIAPEYSLEEIESIASEDNGLF